MAGQVKADCGANLIKRSYPSSAPGGGKRQNNPISLDRLGWAPRLERFASRQQAICNIAPIQLGFVHGNIHSLRKGARIERWNLCKTAHFAKIQNEALQPVRIPLARLEQSWHDGPAPVLGTPRRRQSVPRAAFGVAMLTLLRLPFQPVSGPVGLRFAPAHTPFSSGRSATRAPLHQRGFVVTCPLWG